MKKYFLFATCMMVALSMSLNSCNDQKKNDPSDESFDGQKTENSLLTPEQSMERLMHVANTVTGKFNTADQKAAINLADGLYGKYQNYDRSAFEDRYEHRYDALFAMPKYAKAVLAGVQTPTAIDQTYLFGFVGESAVFEANERSHAWEYKGTAPDNSLILRCTDLGGTTCEAKMWGEGATHRYQYSWEESHWETPKINVSSNNIYEKYGSGYYNGEWRSFSQDPKGRWFYYDWNNGDQEVYVDESDIESIYGYDNDNRYCYYDKQTKQWYYNDYENGYEVYDGKRTAMVDFPDKVIFTLKQGGNEVIRVELKQELVEHNHVYISVNARVANLSWIADVKINSTSGSAAYTFKYGDENLISVAANLPSYELIDKNDNQSFEDWIEQYEDRYDYLLKQVKGVDAFVDINGWVQLKAEIDNFGYLYRDINKLEDGGYHTRNREDAEALVAAIDAHMKTGIYYGSDIKQASVIPHLARERQYGGYWDNTYDKWVDQEYDEYFAEGVLYFPQNGTTYAFDEYFNRKPFTDLEYTIEDIANKYIQLSRYLYDEVGEVAF